MDVVDDPRALAIRLCEQPGLIAAARKRTRVAPELIDDEAVLRGLRGFVSAQPALVGASEEIVVHALVAEAARILRDRLVTTLVRAYDLHAVVRDACERAGIPDRIEQLAYCLVVLCQKADPVRSGRDRPSARHYRLDLGSEEFPSRLREWADTVAANLRGWATVYDTIQDEIDDQRTEALSRLVRLDSRDDVMDVLATKVAGVLGESERLVDMTLARARDVEPAGREYVFQTRLPRWARSIAKHDAPRQHDPLEFGEEDPGAVATGPRGAPEPEPVPDLRPEIQRALIEQIAALRATRGLIRQALELAESVDTKLVGRRLQDPEDDAVLVRVQAELWFVADELRDEQRALGGMLEYVGLAMRRAENRQRVAILSLRDDSIDPEVVDDLAARTRAVLGDPLAPRPALVAKVQQAPRNEVPAGRLSELVRLRDDRGHRAAATAELRRRLDALPAHVAGLDGICAVMPDTTRRAVTVTRSQAARELEMVDRVFGRIFRRYVKGVVR